MAAPGLDFGPGIEVEQDHAIMAQVEAQNAANEKKRAEEKRKFENRLFRGDRKEQAKHYANELFREGKMKEAGPAYERVLSIIEPLPADEDLHVACYSNLSAVRLREWRWKDALEYVDKVLALRPSHAKAFFRQAQAYRGLHEMDMALESIAKSRALTEEGAKGALGELENLENSIKKQVEREAREEKERKAARERKDRRMKELAKKNAHKMEVRRVGNGVKLPPVEEGEEPTGEAKTTSTGMPTWSAADARVTGNWAGWWYKELSRNFTDEDMKMMLHDEDGWVEVLEVPETKAEIYAQVRPNEDGTRTLYYEVNLVLNCMCAQFRAPEDDPGCLGFHIEVHIKNVDNATPPEDWNIYVDYCKPSDYQPAHRIKKMMETYVRPAFVPFVKDQMQSLIHALVSKCTGRAAFKMITDERAERKRQKAKERAEQEKSQAQMAERMKMALDAADADLAAGNDPVGLS